MKNKTILITGATSGIGYATAIAFSKLGANLILCGRREEKLKKLSKEVKVSNTTLQFDVRDKIKVKDSIDNLPLKFKKIDILINNAGNAHGFHSVDEANIDDWDAMIDSNVKGLMYVTKAIIPFMVKNKSGHIINVGSIAGKEVYPKGSVYCSSKFAVDAFTQGLRVDLLKFGIKVSAINPGLVETEFSLVRFKGDNSRAKKVYSGLKPLTAKDVAKSIIYIANTPSHVTIADMVLLPSHQANAYVNIRNK